MRFDDPRRGGVTVGSARGAARRTERLEVGALRVSEAMTRDCYDDEDIGHVAHNRATAGLPAAALAGISLPGGLHALTGRELREAQWTELASTAGRNPLCG